MNIVYVAPNFTANAVRFIEALAGIHSIRLIIISQESTGLLPSWQQSRIAYSRRIPDVFNAASLIQTMTEVRDRMGKLHRCLGATEQLQVPLAEVREALGIEGMDVETAKNFRDKSRMKLLFEKHGIPCAKHKLVTDLHQAVAFTREISFPVVVKPVEGAGSQTTFKVTNDGEMHHAFNAIGDHAKEGVVIEEFITGQEFSLDSFSLDGKIVSQTINQYIPTPLEVMSNPWMQWQVILKKETTGKAFDDIREAGKKALDTLGMKTGLSHMEWFRRNDGSIAISEVAARPPGAQFTTIISRACDVDMISAWARLMIFDEAVKSSIVYTSGAAYLRGQGNGRVVKVEGIDQVRSKYNDMITDIKIPKPGAEKSSSYEGEGFIIVRHRDTQIVEKALADIVNTVKVHLQ